MGLYLRLQTVSSATAWRMQLITHYLLLHLRLRRRQLLTYHLTELLNVKFVT